MTSTLHGDLQLLPRPVSVTLASGFVAAPNDRFSVSGVDAKIIETTVGRLGATLPMRDRASWVEVVIDESLETGAPKKVRSQAYRLELSSAADDSNAPTARIRATTVDGVRYALRTLAQLLEGAVDDRLPVLEIHDWPAFPLRGVMLDVSRDRVPTMEHLFDTVDRLASFKINHLQLYFEHAFAYASHEAIWADASPFTPAEIRELDAFCRMRGVDLAANQNCFGHLQKWLTHPDYIHLAEITGSWDFNGTPRSGPFSLCPTDARSIAFVRELLDQLLPCFSSPLVNIGCDETFDVGQGRSRTAVESRGRSAVYFEFVHQVMDLVRDHGRRPMFWADIALRDPGQMERVPEDAIALAWGYEPDAEFEEWTQVFAKSGREVWVCPGTSSWRSITGRSFERSANLTSAARCGHAGGATGFLVTDWGDCGHDQQWPISMFGLAEGAATAWAGEKWAPDSAPERTPHCFSGGSSFLDAWLTVLGDADLPLRLRWRSTADNEDRYAPLRNAGALYTDLHTPFDAPERPRPVEEWESTRGVLLDLETRFPDGLDELVRAELRQSLAVALLAADRAIARRVDEGKSSRRRENLASRIEGIMDEHARLWRLRSRPGGLPSSLSYYAAIRDDLRSHDQRQAPG
ncbi:MAG: family 20 glycosylhydrolase [Phycisphaerales bacterium]